MPDIPVRTDFPRKVREIDNTWIPMSDGTKLAARIWLPEDAEADPVPAILEYLPYRKRDGTVERDHLTHPYFAGFGYAGVRVDMRGTGDSEGICLGEYLTQEQDDALDVIAWLAAQPWCSGAVGMIGISWGGFNGLQVAARRPPALKAVITLCSTDDRYSDDIHFMGGAMLTDKLAWGATAFAIANTPPDPAIVGDRWREMWKERLENNGLWMLDWFRHQRRDAFYRHGSVCEDFSAIEAAVYAVGGWADGYTNAIFRLLEHLPGPKKGLVGPWAHKYPHFAEPGPRIGFLQECLRWWDQHLKGIDTGIMNEPILRAWVQDPAPPATHYAERPGKWVAEPSWSGTRTDELALTLVPGGLTRETARDGSIVIASPQTVGRGAQNWCSYGLVADLATDQRVEAGGSVVLETGPLEDDLELLGFPILDAEVASDRPVANLAAVLSAVAPDGAATLVTYGVLNLTHRNSHADPAPMTPGKAERVRLQLNVCGQRFAKGQRLRLALSTSYWPVIWPAPETLQLTLSTGKSRLLLPVRKPKGSDSALTPFGAPEGAAPLRTDKPGRHEFSRTETIDLVSGISTYRRNDASEPVTHLHTGIEFGSRSEDVFTIHPDDPNSATGTCRWHKTYRRDDWQATVDAEVTVRALRDVWRIDATLRALDGDDVVAEREWHEDVPRDLV
ncbi:Cocaine esterase [Defluviimonas aquaemixtae]|uniref:Cocaine esterase n=1 Tax=Albidovulum aquaemixtae TaxID=1542388 RepID=A0A2R8BK58_9RHOB|nr:CocE/NonD family hydrolase [Defluviimonas aquaemixtae]SPH23754.1 Cocaine esterase [Defluviimonas aquaemixtae]